MKVCDVTHVSVMYTKLFLLTGILSSCKNESGAAW